MKLSDKSTAKFETELANKQIQNIRQSINNCQLRFGKVMGCGTCKALQSCTWAKELCDTVECMGKHIEALQQENEHLKETLQKFGDKAISKGFLFEEVNFDNIRALQIENEQLRKQAAVDAEVLRKVKDFLDRIYPADVFTGESGDEGVLMIVELRKAIDKVLGGKEDV